MPIWHIDQLKTRMGTVDIGLIRDEANELAPCTGPRPDLPPYGDNIAEMVAQARTNAQAASKTTYTTQSSVSQVVALPRAHPAQPLSPLWSRLRGSKN